MDLLKEFQESYNAGRLLFRYRPVTNKNLQAFKGNRLYFSTPINFNDPFDSLLFVDVRSIISQIDANVKAGMPKYLEQLKSWNTKAAFIGTNMWYGEERDDFLQKYYNYIWGIIDGFKLSLRNNIKVICFSELYDSMLMWSHYGDNHKGYVLVYAKEEFKDARRFSREGEVQNKVNLSPVKYVEKQIDFTEEITNFLRNEVLTTMGDVELEEAELPQKKLRRFALEKSIEWSYEKEWRLLSRTVDLKKESPLYYIKCKPYAVIIGVHCDKDKVERIKQIAKENKINTYRMYLSEFDKDFKLKIGL